MRRWKTMPAKIEPRIGLKHGPMDSNGLGEPRNGRDEHGKHVTAKLHEHDQNGPKKPMGNGHSEPIDSKGNTNNATEKAIVKKQKNVIEPPKPDKKLAENPMKKENPKQIKNGYQTVQNKGRFQHRRGRVAASRGNMASETVEDHPLKEFIGKGVKKDKIGQKDSIKPHDKQQELTKKVAKEDHDIQHKLDNKDDTEKKSHPTNPHFELHAKAQKALEVSDDHLKQTEMHSLSLHKMGSTGRTNSTKNLKQINSSIPKIQGAKSENFVKLSDHHRNDAMKQLEHHKIEKNQDKLKQELTKETKETRENSIPTDKAPQKDHQNKHLIGKIGNDVKTNSHEVGKKELTNNHKSGRLNLFDAHSNKLGGKKDDLRRSKTAPIGFRRLNYVQDSMLKPEKILHKEDEHVNSHPAIPKIVHASPVSVLDFPESDEYSSSSKEHGMNEAKEEKIQKHAHESEESRAHEKVLKKIHTNKSVKAKEGIKNARKPSHPAIPKTQTASPESLFDFPGSDELDYSSAESEIHDEEHEKEIMDHGFPPESLTSTNAEKSPKLHHEQSENLHIKESSHISSVNSNKGPLEIVSEKENKETIKVENEENKVIHKNGPLIDKENPEESKKEKNSSFLDEKLAKSVENKAEDKVEVKKSTSEVEIDNKMVAKTRIEKKQESLEKVSEKIKQNDKSLEEIPMKRKESVLDKVKSIFFGKPESEPIKEVQMVTLDKIVEKDKEGRQNLSKENENEKHKLPPLEESKAKFEGPPKSLMEIFMSMGEKTKRIPKSGPIRKFKELRNRTVWYGYEFDENVAAKTMKKLLPAIPLLFDVFNINSTVQKAFGSIKEKAKQEIKGEEVDLRVNTPDKKPTLIRRIKFDNPLGNLIPFKASFNEFLKIESGRRELNFETLKEFFSKFENFGDKLEKLVKNRKDKHENSFKILSKLKKDKLQELVLNRKVDSDLEKMINQKALSDQKFEEMVKILHENGEAGLSLELEKGIKEKELIEEQLEETIKEFDKSGWDEMVKKNEVDLSVLENIIRYWTDPNKYEGFYIIPIDTYLQMSENAGVKVDGQELDKITDYSIVDQYYFLLAQFENSGRRLKKILGLKLHQIAEKLKNLQEQFNFDHKEKDILEKLLKFSLDTVNIRARDSQDQPAEIYYSLNLDLFIKMWGDKWAYELFQNENLNIGHLLMHTIKAETDGEEYHQMVSAYPTLIKKFDEHFKFFKNFGESEKQVNNIIQSAKGDLDHFMPILEKKVEKMNENLMKIANAPLLKWLGLNSIFSAADKSQAFGKLRDAIKLLLNASTDLKVDKKNKKVTALEKLITDAQKKEKEFTNFKNALKPVHIAAFFEENENAEDGQLDANVVDSPTMLEGQSNAERKEVGMVSQRALNAAIPSPPSPPPPPSKSKLPPRPPPPPPKAGNNASPRSAAPPPIPPGAKIGPPPPPPAPPKIGNSKAPPAPPPPPPSFKSNSNGVKGIPPLPQSSKPIGSPPPVPPPPPPMLHPKKSEKSTNLVKVAENTTNAIKSSINVNNAIKATKIHIDTGQPVTLHHQSVMPAKTILEAHPKTKMEEFMKRKILQMREFQKSSSESASSFEKT